MQIALSIGELAGIGPNIALMSAQTIHPDFLVFADADALKKRAHLLGLDISFTDSPTTQKNTLQIHHIPSKVPVTAGKAESDNAEYILKCLDTATVHCQKHGTGLITLPIHKGVINDAGINFSGHTEYLANITHTKKVVMLLKCQKLAVALATTHLPLSEVAQNITKESLRQIITIIDTSFNSFYGKRPHIMTLGLNPHAGEDGYLGQEEIKIINPVVQNMQQQGIHITRATPADTAFSKENMNNYDVFLAMYHDQGLSVLKTLCFHNAINITLGLPIHRVSVDHGTAFELAHTTHINLGSFKTAIKEIMG